MRRRFAAAGLLVSVVLLPACGSDDEAAATVVAEIEVDPHLGPDIQVAPDGDVWLPASDTFGGTEVAYDDALNVLVRIDTETEKVVASVPVDRPMSALAIGEGGVWAAGTDFGPDGATPRGSLVHVDPETNEVVTIVDLGDGSPSDVVVGFGAVWVADSTADAVHRIDPETGAVVARISIDGGPTSLAVTDRAVWVTKPATGEVRSIDPQTNEPGPAVRTGQDPAVLEAGGAGLFVADYADRTLSLIDPDRARVERSVGFPSAPSRFDVGHDIVAVSEVDEQTLSVVRGDDRDVVLEGRVIVAVALEGRVVWAADAGSGAVIGVRLPPD